MIFLDDSGADRDMTVENDTEEEMAARMALRVNRNGPIFIRVADRGDLGVMRYDFSIS